MPCQLVDDAFSILIQCVLGFFALLSLSVKRITENPKRPFRVFIYDISKQVVGSLYAHGLNILIAINVSHNSVNNRYSDQCMWYFVNFLVDVFFGMILNWMCIKIINNLAKRYGIVYLVSGNYTLGDSFINKQYLLQLFVWILIITIVKLVLFFGVLIPGSNTLGHIGTIILSPISKHGEVELIVVMILVPLSLNILQFWIQDTFLKGDVFTDTNSESDIDEYSDDSPSPPPITFRSHLHSDLEVNSSGYTSL